MALFYLPSASLAAVYDEAVDGDLSNQRLAPTALSIGLESNRLLGNIHSNEVDYFTIRVPTGSVMSAIVVDDYRSLNSRAFIGFQAGTTVSFEPIDADPALLLGYAHYGFDTPAGTNLLPIMATAFGAAGFTSPLAAGDYTFWLNQTEPIDAAYAFSFVVVPEPAMASLLIAAGAIAASRRRVATPIR